ncbi:MAG: hypothetical protein ABIG64_02400 [Candidatus Omnitrophota bacterium]
MMEKKRSSGIIFFSLLNLICGLLTLYYAFKFIAYTGEDELVFNQLGIFTAILCPLFFLASYLAFRLNKKGRIMNLLFSPVTAFMIWTHIRFIIPCIDQIRMPMYLFIPIPYYLFLIICTGCIIYYFNRPKVKAQFNPEK